MHREPSHVLRYIKAASHPDARDHSCPKFAEDDQHLLAVSLANNGRGFPWLNIDYRARAA